MAESVRNKFFSGLAWTFIQNIASRGLGFVFMILLTRLLSPGDFGLIGMLSIFIAISEVFILSGFGEALIQKKNCNDDDYSTAFYFNVAIAVVIYFILFCGAPLIASFYHEEQLVLLTRVLGLNFVLGSLNIVQQSKLTKAMNFKPLAILTLIGTFFSGVVGVTMAYFDYGVWALVAQTLCSTLLRVILFPFFTKWHPNRPFNVDSLRHLWNYGSKLLVTGIIGVVNRNLSNILIGRYYEKDQVGFFSRSQTFAAVPSETMFYVLSTVTFPALCEVQDDKDRLLSVYRKVLFNTMLVVSPVIIILALLAKPIVIILFTERWAACIPLLQALLLSRMFLPMGATHTSLLRSVGNTSLYMKLYFITSPLSLFAIGISIPYGVEAMAWAAFIGAFLSYIIEASVIGSKFGYTIFMQLRDWRKIFLSLAVMVAIIWLSTHWLTNLWAQLLTGGLLGGIVYFACCKFFYLIDEDLKNMIMAKLNLKH